MEKSYEAVKLNGKIHTPIWSGERLSKEYSAFGACGRIGEAWMTAPDAVALTEHGPIQFGEFLIGTGLPCPPLVKLIDAASPLSLQVHPDDEAAIRLGGVSKNEIWYVLYAEVGAEILYGTAPDVTLSDLKAEILEGEALPLTQRIPVKARDVFPIPAGMIHSLGGGITVLEVQNRIGTTYRVKDIAGNRETHQYESSESVKIISPDEAANRFRSSESLLPGMTIASSDDFQISKYETDDIADETVIPLSGVYMFCERGGGNVGNLCFTVGDSIFLTDEFSTVSLSPDSSVILVK